MVCSFRSFICRFSSDESNTVVGFISIWFRCTASLKPRAACTDITICANNLRLISLNHEHNERLNKWFTCFTLPLTFAQHKYSTLNFDNKLWSDIYFRRTFSEKSVRLAAATWRCHDTEKKSLLDKCKMGVCNFNKNCWDSFKNNWG